MRKTSIAAVRRDSRVARAESRVAGIFIAKIPEADKARIQGDLRIRATNRSCRPAGLRRLSTARRGGKEALADPALKDKVIGQDIVAVGGNPEDSAPSSSRRSCAGER
jgi:hypothetical protein